MLTDDPPIRIFPENLYLKEYNLKLLTPETMEIDQNLSSSFDQLEIALTNFLSL